MSASASAPSGARPTCLSGMDPGALGEHLAAGGVKPGHAARLLRAHLAGVNLGPATLPGMPARVFRPLGELLEHEPPVVARARAADGTTKLLLRLADGRTVESVLMPDYRSDRAAGCLSTQVGCAMGCDFCATTRSGFERNLTSGEILAQLVALRREARAAGRELRTVVLMGMGEPLLNLEAVLPAVRQ
ncbi:MAG: 23S rRNA (adenine(2503)-C(2))-methyltransferase RlmN, partial [Verrucomicrobiota bacterium]